MALIIKDSGDGLTFLINDKPYGRGGYEIDYPKSSDYFFSIRNISTGGTIAESKREEWRDSIGDGFGSLQDFADSIKSFFFKASSGGGGIPSPSPSGSEEFISIDGVQQWDTRPYSVDDGTTDARFNSDVYVQGELFTQQQTVYLGGGVKLGASNEIPLLNTLDKTSQRVLVTANQELGLTRIPRYPNRYEYWDKNSPTGQFQPNQTTTLDSIINPNYNPDDSRNPVTGYQHQYAIIVQAQGDLQVLNWFLRSATGFDNYYVKMYKGVDLTPVAGSLPLWQSHTDKQIANGDCFTHPADVNNDIQFNLGNTHYQNDGQIYTFIGYAESAFQFEAGVLNVPPFPPIDYPYVIADGYFVYNTPTFLPSLVVGATENIEGTQNMNNGQVYGITKNLFQGDYNYTDVILFQNGLNNANQTAKLRVAIYDAKTNELISEGVQEVDNTYPDRSVIRINHNEVLQVERNISVKRCIVVNDYSQGGIITLVRTRSQNVNEEELIFNTQLSTGGFPSLFSSLPNPSPSSNTVNSVTNFDVGSIFPLNQSFIQVYQ